MTQHTNTTDRPVHGIKTGLALIEHDPAEIGFCSLRSITFDGIGQVVATSVDLSRGEAEDLIRGLERILGRGPMERRTP